MPSSNKLKVLPSTMRENKRYLLINTKNQDKIKKAILEFLGVFGWAKAGPLLIPQENNTILSIERSSLDQVRTALELAGLKCLGVSGTINKLKEKFGKGKL